MSPDDRFLPQGKQIFPKICQVRPMPFVVELKCFVKLLECQLSTYLADHLFTIAG